MKMMIVRPKTVLDKKKKPRLVPARGLGILTFTPLHRGFRCNQTGEKTRNPGRYARMHRHLVSTPPPKPVELLRATLDTWNHRVTCPHCMNLHACVYNRGEKMCSWCGKKFLVV